MKRWILVLAGGLVALATGAGTAHAIPAFARKYRVSCSQCHAPVPRLNEFGELFAGNGFEFAIGEEPRDTLATGDPLLRLQSDIPLAVRFDMYVRAQNEPKGGQNALDFQVPWGIKLLTGGQVADRIKIPVQTVGPFVRTNPPVQLLSSFEVVGAAFGLGVGQTSGPIVTDDGVFFVQPVSKKLADSTAFTAQLETQRAQVIQSARQARVRDVIAALRQDARVIDRRRELEEQARELEESGQLLPQAAGF